MSELEYDKNWAGELLAAGITPASTPLNIRGLLKQIIEHLGGLGFITDIIPDSSETIIVTNGLGPTVQLGVATSSNIDGGSASSVYLLAQVLNGGNA